MIYLIFLVARARQNGSVQLKNNNNQKKPANHSCNFILIFSRYKTGRGKRDLAGNKSYYVICSEEHGIMLQFQAQATND